MIQTACRRLPALLLLLGLAACSAAPGGGQPGYLLPAGTAAATHPEAGAAIAVAPVRVADFLDGEGIVMQLSDIEVYPARQHLWAQELPGQLQQLLQQRLAAALPAAQVVSRGQPLLSGLPAREVRLRLDRFQGRYDGVALAQGQWQLLDGQGRLLAQADFSVARPLPEDGYPALVRTLAAAWEQVADELAAELALSL